MCPFSPDVTRPRMRKLITEPGASAHIGIMRAIFFTCLAALLVVPVTVLFFFIYAYVQSPY